MSKRYLPDSEIKCPYTQFERSCRDIVSSVVCPKYICVVGTNPNTGEHVDQWGCNESFREALMIENSQQQRMTASAVESFRNEMVKANDTSRQVLMATLEMTSANPNSHRPAPPLAEQGAGPVAPRFFGDHK